MPDHRMTRRELLIFALVATAGGGVQGCTGRDGDPASAPSRPAAPPSVDEQTAWLLLSDKRHLLDRYAAVGMAHPGLSGRIAPLVAHHEDHRGAVAGAAGVRLEPGSRPPRAPSPAPNDAAAAVGELAAAEQAAGRRRTLLVASAESSRLAAVLASVGACELAHAIHLGAEVTPVAEGDWPAGAFSSREIAALQTAIEARHAAIYGYGVVGARLPVGDRPAAMAAFEEHRRARDRLVDEIRRSGVEPSAAAPAYELPSNVTTASAARELAAYLEEGIEVTCATLVNVARTTELRLLATRTLACATVRRTAWGGALTAFPGLALG